MTRVKIAEIDIKGCQSRVATNGNTVTEYAELIESGVKFPPVELYYDGSTYWCADGIHRILAASRLKRADIEATVHKGSREDALWHAASANKTHGLHRSNEDKKRAVELALSLHPEKSDRAIAEHVGVNEKTVGVHRKRMESTAEIPQLDTREGKDGKTRKATTVQVGQSPKEAGAQVAHLEKREGRDGKSYPVKDRVKDETPPETKPPKNGSPKVPTPKRKAAIKAHGALFRALDAIGIGNRCKKPMHEVYEEIENA